MSCWCDGDDPGCERCHPSMTAAARVAFRAEKAAMVALLKLALSEHVQAHELADAAKAYREAKNMRSRFDGLGRTVGERR
jgi:hypothetical protein